MDGDESMFGWPARRSSRFQSGVRFAFVRLVRRTDTPFTPPSELDGDLRNLATVHETTRDAYPVRRYLYSDSACPSSSSLVACFLFQQFETCMYE